MTVEENTGEVIAEVIDPVVEEIKPDEPDAPKEPTRDFVTEARALNWVPEAEFRGPKKYWKDAEQYVLDGEQILPLVKSQNKKLIAENAAKEKDFSERLAKIERMNNLTQSKIKASLKASHEAKLANVKSQLRQAASDGDMPAYDNLSKRIDDMAQSAPVDEPQHNPQDEIAKAHREFKEKNTWYDSDPALQAAANGISQGLDPNMSVHENLRQTEAKVKELFPEKFRPPKIRNDAVDGGGVFSNVAKKAGPSASLPKEALAQAKVDVANGTYKNVDEWAKAYNDGVGTYD